MVKLLVEAQAQLNSECPYGTTALCCAARYRAQCSSAAASTLCCSVGSEECLRELVKFNADPNLGTWSGKSSLSRASMHGEVDAIEVIHAFKCLGSETRAAKVLAELGAAVNMAGSDGCTPLMHAAVHGQLGEWPQPALHVTNIPIQAQFKRCSNGGRV